MRLLTILCLLLATSCSYSKVTVVTVVTKVDSKKNQNPDVELESWEVGAITIVPQILKALPEAEEALEKYQERNREGND